MKPLYTKSQFNNAKSTDKLPCECYVCKNTFFVRKNLIKFYLSGNDKFDSNKSCSKTCFSVVRNKKQLVNCKNCKTKFLKTSAEIKKSNNHFCSSSCSATYSNTHKTHGTRRSKLEIYLEQQLIYLYPNLEIHFNKKDAINSELDIYIPSLRLAFELNGIYHYEPIHGSDKLGKVQSNDQRKFQACAEQSISLCIIDISKQKYFKESTSQEFLNIIIDIITINQRTMWEWRDSNSLSRSNSFTDCHNSPTLSHSQFEF